jgi:Ankyrin repeats (many copies)
METSNSAKQVASSCPILGEAESKQLLALCRAGKLYAIEQWIRDGQSLSVAQNLKKTPLQIAVEHQFHSLVELLARNETSSKVRNDALALAVRERRTELAELLVACGSDPRSVPLSEVLLSWDPKLIRFFIDCGADVITGHPFAEAFGARVRTAVRVFREYKQSHPEQADALRDQINRALRYHCHEKDAKWVSLLLWTGADPRARGPRLYDKDDPECYGTALEEACYSGDVAVVKALRPSADDNLCELLDCAALSGRIEALRYLLEIGADPNDKPNGGSTALDRSLWRIEFDAWRPGRDKRLVGKYESLQSLRVNRRAAKGRCPVAA